MEEPMLAWLIVLGCGESSPTASPPLPPPAPPPPPVVEEPMPELELPPPTEERYAASHILVAWAGAVDATTSRDKEAARDLAEQIRQRALAGEDFADLARSHSDGPSGARGGALGVYVTGTMVPPFEAGVASVGVGQIGPLVESPFGFHVVRRDAIREARGAHILIQHADAWRSTSERTLDEARALARAARDRVRAGEDFARVAAEVSEDPTALVGGDLGIVAPGQLVPDFEAALFALEPGEISDLVETPYGVHVISRLPSASPGSKPTGAPRSP